MLGDVHDHSGPGETLWNTLNFVTYRPMILTKLIM